MQYLLRNTKAITKMTAIIVGITIIVVASIAGGSWYFLNLGDGVLEDEYMKAARDFAYWVGEDTVLSRDELLQEAEFFAKASQSLRGTTLHIMYEAVPAAEWEYKNLKTWFEKITGITTTWDAIDNWATVQKSIEDSKLKAGIFDVIGSDQDMVGFYSYYESALDLTEFMQANPDMVPPYIDLEDFYAKATYSNPKNGHLMQLLAYNWPTATVYRKDWFTDPQNKADFKAQYGYELKTPMEYYLTAKSTGNVNDDWTTDKAIDTMEFFTRPEDDMWGTLGCLKAGPHLAFMFGDTLDDAFQLPSAAPSGKTPNQVAYFEPISSSWGLHIEDNVLLGASVENGGMLNSPEGIAMFSHFIKMGEYGPAKSYEVDNGESYTAFATDGKYAMIYPHYCAFSAVYNHPFISKVKGVYEYGPLPIYAQAAASGKSRGYIDPSGWTISSYSKNPKAAFLFAAFMTSKAADLKKNLETGTPIRWSTITSQKFMAMDESLGGLATYMTKVLPELCGTDGRLAIYPELVTVISDKTAECFQQRLSGEATANSVAKAIDDWLVTNGWMGRKLVS